MNDLCVDVGFNSLIKKNEVLCGDNVSTITCEDGTFIAVLADGLGSGVKACILSTLTSKIISTMVSENIDISECVKTIAATLPICQVRGLAYSTFTILKILPTQEAEIFQYDNPDVIFMRDGKNVELPYVSMNIDGKEITHTKVKLLENDTFILMSDGVIHAGVQAGGMSYAFGWERENIVDYMEIFSDVGFSAKTLCSILLDECYAKYSGSPGDDSTVCVVKLRKRNQVNLLIGRKSGRLRQDDVSVLFKRRQAYRLRRNNKQNCRKVPRQTAQGQSGFGRRSEHSGKRGNRRCRSRYRRRYNHEPCA